MMKTADFVELEERYGAHNYHPLDVVIERAEGVWVWDVEGNRYLDCLAAYSAVNQGHCHPKIRAAAIEQMGRVTLVSRAFRTDQLGPFYQELCELTGMDMVLPMNSGAEGVETAVKTARKWGYRVKGIPEDQAEILVCSDNFHGRTITCVSFSTEPLYRRDFGPYTPGFKVIPFGDAAALAAAIGPNTCAFLVEPIQGEAGILMPPDGWLRQVAEECKKRNVLLVLDEVQTGLGRTGALFACMHESVRPDILVAGKALGGGFYPVSAVLARKEVLGVYQPGEHGSTFGGNPLAAAIARASLRVIVEEKLVERSAELGEYFLARLRATLQSPDIRDIRGKGLFIGLEMATAARPYCEALKEQGLLCKETHDRVIRFAPPLVITREEIDWAIDRIRKVVDTPSART
jgi:ornithine--oxo-acid transaminase